MMTLQVVTYRKHRPQRFQDIVGQAHVTATLCNALRAGSLAQSIVLAGPRGTGKTTCARVLAQALNCTQRTEAAEPCHTCPACKRSVSQRSISLFEIDAASHNSVEDVRALVEQVRYPPQGDAYKVYIIDEAHMLSNAAFNALLKTLEEPPSYVVFVLATTEKHKILPTVLSRCQVFDFKPIQVQQIIDRLEEIARQERIPYELEALKLIAQHADGSLRDALSYFDLVAATPTEKCIAYADACTHLHVLSPTHCFEMTTYLSGGQVQKALEKYDAVLKLGFDDYFFVVGLTAHLRNVLMCQSAHGAALVSVSKDLQDRYRAQAEQTSSSVLTQALGLLNRCLQQYRQSHYKRLHVELTLIEITNLSAARNQPEPKPAAFSSEKPMQPAREARIKPSKKTEPSAAYPSISLPSLQQLQQHLDAPSSSGQDKNTEPPPDQDVLGEAEVQRAWTQYMHTCQAEGRMRLYSARHSTPRLVSKDVVALTCTHKLHHQILMQHRGDVQTALSQQLKRQISVQIDAVLQEPSTKTPYTTLEKYRALTQQWPIVDVLQEKLALDVES